MLNDTFQFDYLMPVLHSAWSVSVMVQCDLDCSMVDELSNEFDVEIVLYAAAVLVPDDTVPGYCFDGSVNTESERWFDDLIGIELVSYFDADLTEKQPVMHSVDKVTVNCLNGFVVLNNLHNYCRVEIDLAQNNSHDYDCLQYANANVKWPECDIVLFARKLKDKST